MPSLNTGNAILSNAIAVDSSYNVGIGGAASGSFKLQVTGTSNLTGALTGTSATFSGAVTSTLGSSGVNFNSNAATTGQVNAYRISNTTGVASFGIDNSTGGNLMTGGLGYATLLQSISNTPLQLGTNQTARLTILSGGDIGIGTNTPSSRLEIRTFVDSDHGLKVTYAAASNGRGIWINQPNGGGGGGATQALIYANNSGNNPYVTFDSIFTIQKSGNVGIGIISPVDRLTVARNVADNSGGLTLYNEDTSGYGSAINFRINYAGVYNASRIHGDWDSGNTGALHFFTANTSQTLVERMLINGNGTIDIKANNNNVSGMNGLIVRLGSNCDNTSSYGYVLETGGANRCFIYGNGNIVNTNNSYGPISDIKLKENIVDTTPKLNDLMKVRIVNYNLKTDLGYDSNKQIGIIAQELEQIFPGLVDNHQDRDSEGNDLGTTTKSVKMSVFVPMLIKAIQELTQKVENQQQTINSLINR